MTENGRLSDDTVIWRYMKLNSFLELLSGRFVQSRIDQLSDAAEGAYGWKELRFSRQLAERLGGNGDVKELIRRARRHVVGTFWVEFERESFGMWNVYGRSGESVALETDVGTLRKILGRRGELHVERMRYEPLRGEVERVETLFFHKRREYRDEREIRSLQVFPTPLAQPILDERLSIEDLEALLERVILAPDSRDTFVEAVEHVVKSVFAASGKRFSGRVERSALDQDLVP
jgi:hypothetical protein